MRLKHFDYIKLVTQAYQRARERNELSPLLVHSTPANIRRECINVYKERYQKKDDQVLRVFFGPAEHGRQFLQLIQAFETNKFKPLDNYLKGVTERTDDRNIELLAWLIDFKHRPYEFDKHIVLSQDELAVLEEPIAITQGTEYDDLLRERMDNEDYLKDGLNTGMGKPSKHSSFIPPVALGNTLDRKSTRAFLAFLIFVICTGGIYLIWGNGNSDCMYWVNDHYQKVPCNENLEGRLLLPLNEKRMSNLKQITQNDTITERSIGKLFYIKDSNRIKYFTAGGNYPKDITRRLKKLTRYIFEKDSVNRK